MRRESHVRFWEGPGVQFPRATRLVMVFKSERDARRAQAVLEKRFTKYGLRLHPEKTKLMRFRPPPSQGPKGSEAERERSFDLLGFTFYWGLSRKKTWVVKQKTSKSSLSKALRRISIWCKRNRHEPMKQQQQALKAKLQGHYSYYGITGNSPALNRFALQVRRRWHYWLARRSNRGMAWDRMKVILKVFRLPAPRVVHSVYKTT